MDIFASRLVEFVKIFINTLAGLLFLANLIAVPVCMEKMLNAETQLKEAEYMKKAVVHLWATAGALLIFYITRDWGIQIW